MILADQPDKIANLIAAAQTAEAGYDHDSAVASYSAALAMPELSMEERVELLDGRAIAFRHWGNQNCYAQDVADLLILARQIGEKRRLAEVLAVHGFYLASDGPQEPPEEFALEAIALAGEFQDDRLLCYGQLTLAQIRYSEGAVDSAWQLLHNALKLARSSQDEEALFTALEFLAGAFAVYNQPEEAQRLAKEARALAGASGSLYEIARAAEKSALAATDLALSRLYYEKAFAAAKTAGNEAAVSEIANQMGLLAWKLGLYDNALAYAGQAVESARRMGLHDRAANDLDAVGRAYLGKGLLAEARLAVTRVSARME